MFTEHDKREILDEIDGIDEEIVELLSERQKRTDKLGIGRHEQVEPVVQQDRFAKAIEHVRVFGEALGLDAQYLDHVWEEIHRGSVAHQNEVMAEAMAITQGVIAPQAPPNGTFQQV